MPNDGIKKQSKRILVLDGDKLGHIMGVLVALVVMAICFFVQKADGYTTAIRVGWAFVVAYGATFVLIRIILRVTLFEFVVDKKKKERSLGDDGDSEKTETGTSGATPPATPEAQSSNEG